MDSTPTTQCPLCNHALPGDQLHEHILREARDIRNYTIRRIRADHPDWVEVDGTCLKCWDYYKKL